MIRKTLAGILCAGAVALGGCQNGIIYHSIINGKEITFEDGFWGEELTVEANGCLWYFNDRTCDGKVDFIKHSCKSEVAGASELLNVPKGGFNRGSVGTFVFEKADEVYGYFLKLIKDDIQKKMTSSKLDTIPAEKP